MSAGYQLLLMIAGMHVLGLICVAVLMVLAFRQTPGDDMWPSDPGSDDGWGNDPREPRQPYDRPWGPIPPSEKLLEGSSWMIVTAPGRLRLTTFSATRVRHDGLWVQPRIRDNMAV